MGIGLTTRNDRLIDKQPASLRYKEWRAEMLNPAYSLDEQAEELLFQAEMLFMKVL